MNRILENAVFKKYGRHFCVQGILCAVIIFWLVLFIGGLFGYSGSKLIYTLFSLIFFVMLASGFYCQISYGYLFLVVMLWLGFWLKLTVNIILDYPFQEPIGLFSSTAEAWDEVLWVAIVAGVGVILSRAVYSLINNKSIMLVRPCEFRVPAWYPAMRKWLWFGIVMITVILAAFNIIYGIQQNGLIPRTIMIWPLNAVIAWMLISGLAIAVATLLWWDISYKKNVLLGVCVILMEAFFSTISLLSRAVYVFKVIPQMWVLYLNRTSIIGYSYRKAITVLFVFAGLLLVALLVVNTMRAYYYSNATSSFFDSVASNDSVALNDPVALARFGVDRWVGVEGVMAVVSYPNKSKNLFLRALTERAQIGKTTTYQDVCLSHYRYANMNKFAFASIPGPAAFFYYTGSLWVVAFGMFVFVLVLFGIENLVFNLTGNPIICTLFGMTLANFIAQFGLAPMGYLPYLFMLFCGLLFIWFIQSRLFNRVILKSGFLKDLKT